MSSYLIPNVVAKDPRGDRVLDVYSHLLAERIVYLGTEVDDGVANALIAQLLHLEAESPDEPINLYVNSPGGSMSAVFAIYDTMQFVRAPVATTCVGQACSTAAILLAAGAPGRRSVLPHSRVLLHQPSARGQGPIPDLILQADEVIRVRAEAEEILSRHTGQSVETLRRDTDRDRIFTPAQAVAYGLADRVMGSREA
jgi:ATP-dependent Clp protease protease subunit